jgi:hypothetical protein
MSRATFLLLSALVGGFLLLTPLSASAVDSDSDGIDDAVELANGTDPFDDDTDDDLLQDGVEDSDQDGTVDAGETDPLDADTDDDALFDGGEDADGDGMVDAGETDPLDDDTDDDGLSDGLESGVTAYIPDGWSDGNSTPFDGTDSSWQPDTDGSSTTDPLDADTDDDGLCDGAIAPSGCIGGEDSNANGRVDTGETDPQEADSDDDGFSDGDEVAAGTDPLDPDSFPREVPAIGPAGRWLLGALLLGLTLAFGGRAASRDRRVPRRE